MRQMVHFDISCDAFRANPPARMRPWRISGAIHHLSVRRNAVAGRVLRRDGVARICSSLVPVLAGDLAGDLGRETNGGSLGTSIELVVSARELNDPEARKPGRRALPVVQGHQPGSPLIECGGDMQQINGTHSGVSGRGRGQALGLRKDRLPIDCGSNQPAGRQVTREHGHRSRKLFVVDFLAEPLEPQRISRFDFMQIVDDDSFSPLGEESSDGIAEILPDVELYQYAGVVVETHRSPRPSAIVSVAVMPLLGRRVDLPQATLSVAPIGLRRFGRHRDDPRDGLSSTIHLNHFAALNLGENRGEMVLDVADVERFHVRQSA